MPQMGFELTIPMFERAKTVQSLDRAATVIGASFHNATEFLKTDHGGMNVTVFFQWLFQPIQFLGLLFSSVIIFHRR
jgi:hypothetical protein